MMIELDDAIGFTQAMCRACVDDKKYNVGAVMEAATLMSLLVHDARSDDHSLVFRRFSAMRLDRGKFDEVRRVARHVFESYSRIVQGVRAEGAEPHQQLARLHEQLADFVAILDDFSEHQWKNA